MYKDIICLVRTYCEQQKLMGLQLANCAFAQIYLHTHSYRSCWNNHKNAKIYEYQTVF